MFNYPVNGVRRAYYSDAESPGHGPVQSSALPNAAFVGPDNTPLYLPSTGLAQQSYEMDCAHRTPYGRSSSSSPVVADTPSPGADQSGDEQDADDSETQSRPSSRQPGGDRSKMRRFR